MGAVVKGRIPRGGSTDDSSSSGHGQSGEPHGNAGGNDKANAGGNGNGN